MLSGPQSVKPLTLLPPTENLYVLNELFEVSKLKIVFFQFMGKLTCSHMQDISTQHHNGITLFSVYFFKWPCNIFLWVAYSKLLLKALSFLSILCAVILCFQVVYIYMYLEKKMLFPKYPRGGYS